MLPIAETNEMKRPHLRGRFAPSPSGRFHIGNIFASLIAALVADEMVLRIEDLDPDRSKQEHIDAIMCDLEWFGFELDKCGRLSKCRRPAGTLPACVRGA